MLLLPPHLRAILWMTGTLFVLVLLGVAARELTVIYDTSQILLLRSGVGFAVIMLILCHQGPRIMRTVRPGLHLLRNLIHLAAVATWFYGIARLPLAEVFVLESTLPLWVIVLAAPCLGERITAT